MMDDGVPNPSTIQLPSPLGGPFLGTLGVGSDGMFSYVCPSAMRRNGLLTVTAGLKLTSISTRSDCVDLGELVNARTEGAPSRHVGAGM